MNFNRIFRNYLFAFNVMRRNNSRTHPNQISIISAELNVLSDVAKRIIQRYKLVLDVEDLQQTIKFCRNIGYTEEDMLKYPKLLNVKSLVLDQRYLVLREGGVKNVTPYILYNFRTIFNSTIKTMKDKEYLPKEVNVPELFISHLKPQPDSLDIHDFNDETVYSRVHLQVMKRYLMWLLDASYEDIERLFRVYKMIQNKSFAYLCENIKIAQELGFTKEKLLKYGYLLHSYPPYTKTMLSTMPNLAGADLAKSMRVYPKLVMVSPRNYKLIYEHLKNANIPDETIQNAMNVFHLSPKTVQKRLKEIQCIPELKVHLFNPKILQIIIHHNRAKRRLEFLQQEQLKCASFYILGTDQQDNFDNYIKEGKDINLQSETFKFFKSLLNTDSDLIEKNLKVHPFYLQVPFTEIEKTYKYLRKLHFNNKDLIHFVSILLYPIKKIDETFAEVEVKYKNVSKKQKLNLMVYFMEKDYHFTGNGIWSQER